MNIEQFIIPPTAISLLTTNKCTATCKDCCLACNPRNKDRLTFEEMKNYINQSIEAYPSIRVLVITGGECFTLGKDLDKIIKYGANKRLIVRIVTNGYWAKSFKKAYLRLKQLKNLGLKEFSDNPKEFINKFGYDKEISLDESLLKLVLSLADEDINSALNDNDIQRFYYVCKQKNLLDIGNSYFKDISQEQIQIIANELGLNKAYIGEGDSIVFPVAIICAAAVVVYLVTHNEVYVTEEYKFGLQYSNNFEKILVEPNPVLTIWTMKDKDFATPILVNTFLEDQINEIIKVINNENSDFFKNNSEDYLRNLIKVNIINKQL